MKQNDNSADLINYRTHSTGMATSDQVQETQQYSRNQLSPVISNASAVLGQHAGFKVCDYVDRAGAVDLEEGTRGPPERINNSIRVNSAQIHGVLSSADEKAHSLSTETHVNKAASLQARQVADPSSDYLNNAGAARAMPNFNSLISQPTSEGESGGQGVPNLRFHSAAQTFFVAASSSSDGPSLRSASFRRQPQPQPGQQPKGLPHSAPDDDQVSRQHTKDEDPEEPDPNPPKQLSPTYVDSEHSSPATGPNDVCRPPRRSDGVSSVGAVHEYGRTTNQANDQIDVRDQGRLFQASSGGARSEQDNTSQSLHGFVNAYHREEANKLAMDHHQSLRNAEDVAQTAQPPAAMPDQHQRKRSGSRNVPPNQQLSTIMSKSVECMSSYNAAQNSCEDRELAELAQVELGSHEHSAESQEKPVQLQPVHRPINSDSVGSSLAQEMQFDRFQHQLSTNSHPHLQSEHSAQQQDCQRPERSDTHQQNITKQVHQQLKHRQSQASQSSNVLSLNYTASCHDRDGVEQDMRTSGEQQKILLALRADSLSTTSHQMDSSAHGMTPLRSNQPSANEPQTLLVHQHSSQSLHLRKHLAARTPDQRPGMPTIPETATTSTISRSHTELGVLLQHQSNAAPNQGVPPVQDQLSYQVTSHENHSTLEPCRNQKNVQLPSSYANSISDGDNTEKQMTLQLATHHQRNAQQAQAHTTSDGNLQKQSANQQFDIYSFQNPTSNGNSTNDQLGTLQDNHVAQIERSTMLRIGNMGSAMGASAEHPQRRQEASQGAGTTQGPMISRSFAAETGEGRAEVPLADQYLANLQRLVPHLGQGAYPGAQPQTIHQQAHAYFKTQTSDRRPSAPGERDSHELYLANNLRRHSAQHGPQLATDTGSNSNNTHTAPAPATAILKDGPHKLGTMSSKDSALTSQTMFEANKEHQVSHKHVGSPRRGVQLDGHEPQRHFVQGRHHSSQQNGYLQMQENLRDRQAVAGASNAPIKTLDLQRIASAQALESNEKESEFNRIHRITTNRSSSAANMAQENAEQKSKGQLASELQGHSHRGSNSKDAVTLGVSADPKNRRIAQHVQDESSKKPDAQSPGLINGNQVVLVNKSDPSSLIGSGRKIEAPNHHGEAKPEEQNPSKQEPSNSRERRASIDRFKDQNDRAISPIHEEGAQPRAGPASKIPTHLNTILSGPMASGNGNQQHPALNNILNSPVYEQHMDTGNLQFNLIMAGMSSAGMSSNHHNRNEHESIQSSELPSHLLKSMPPSQGPFVIHSIDTDQVATQPAANGDAADAVKAAATQQKEVEHAASGHDAGHSAQLNEASLVYLLESSNNFATGSNHMQTTSAQEGTQTQSQSFQCQQRSKGLEEASIATAKVNNGLHFAGKSVNQTQRLSEEHETSTWQESNLKHTDQNLKAADLGQSRSSGLERAQDVQDAMAQPICSDDADSVNPLQLTSQQNLPVMQHTNQQFDPHAVYGVSGSTKGYLSTSDDRVYSTSDMQNTKGNYGLNSNGHLQLLEAQRQMLANGQAHPVEPREQGPPVAWRQSSELQNHTEVPPSIYGPGPQPNQLTEESYSASAQHAHRQQEYNMAASVQHESQLHGEVNMMQGTLGVSDTSQILMLSHSRNDNTEPVDTHQTSNSLREVEQNQPAPGMGHGQPQSFQWSPTLGADEQYKVASNAHSRTVNLYAQVPGGGHGSQHHHGPDGVAQSQAVSAVEHDENVHQADVKRLIKQQRESGTRPYSFAENNFQNASTMYQSKPTSVALGLPSNNNQPQMNYASATEQYYHNLIQNQRHPLDILQDGSMIQSQKVCQDQQPLQESQPPHLQTEQYEKQDGLQHQQQHQEIHELQGRDVTTSQDITDHSKVESSQQQSCQLFDHDRREDSRMSAPVSNIQNYSQAPLQRHELNIQADYGGRQVLAHGHSQHFENEGQQSSNSPQMEWRKEKNKRSLSAHRSDINDRLMDDQHHTIFHQDQKKGQQLGTSIRSHSQAERRAQDSTHEINTKMGVGGPFDLSSTKIADHQNLLLDSQTLKSQTVGGGLNGFAEESSVLPHLPRGVNTPSSSTLPPRVGGLAPVRSGFQSQGPAQHPSGTANMVDILKQELLSTKRQLKDAQSSHQFIKKEKLRIEHEKNLLEIETAQDKEKTNEQLQKQQNQIECLKNELNKATVEKDNAQAYVQDLLKMNDLQVKENDMIIKKKENSDHVHMKTIQQYSNELAEMQKRKMRNFEKVYAQVLQLRSVAEHLKDLVGLAKLDEYKSNTDQIQEYIESNFENSVLQLIKVLHEGNVKTSKESSRCGKSKFGTYEREESESTLEGNLTFNNLKFDPEKINTRANNFKKFRQSTTDLIKQLVEYQLESKCQIIKELESQMATQSEKSKRESRQKDAQINELDQNAKILAEKYEQQQKELNQLNKSDIPNLNSKLLAQETRIRQEHSEVESSLRQQILKQNFKIMELEEKEKMHMSENTQLRIQAETLKVQVKESESKTQQQQMSMMNPFVSQQQLQQLVQSMINQNQSKEGAQAQKKADDSHDDLLKLLRDAQNTQSMQSLIQEKQKNKKLKEKTTKQTETHQREKEKMQEQLQEYKETVQKQADLIGQLQRLSQMQKSLILSHTNSQKNEGEGTQSERTLEPKGIDQRMKQATLGSELSNRDDEVARLNRKVQRRGTLSERNPTLPHPKNMSFIENTFTSQGPHQALGPIADALPGAGYTQPVHNESNQSSLHKGGQRTGLSHREHHNIQIQSHEQSVTSGSCHHQAIVPRPLTQYSESQVTITTNTNKNGGPEDRHSQQPVSFQDQSGIVSFHGTPDGPVRQQNHQTVSHQGLVYVKSGNSTGTSAEAFQNTHQSMPPQMATTYGQISFPPTANMTFPSQQLADSQRRWHEPNLQSREQLHFYHSQSVPGRADPRPHVPQAGATLPTSGPATEVAMTFSKCSTEKHSMPRASREQLEGTNVQSDIHQMQEAYKTFHQSQLRQKQQLLEQEFSRSEASSQHKSFQNPGRSQRGKQEPVNTFSNPPQSFYNYTSQHHPMSQSTLHHRPFSPPSEDRALSHFASQPDPAEIGSGPVAIRPPRAIALPSHRVHSSEMDQEQLRANVVPPDEPRRDAHESEPKLKQTADRNENTNTENIRPKPLMNNYNQAIKDNTAKLNTLSLESNQQEEEQLKNMTFSRGHNMTFARQPDGSHLAVAIPTVTDTLGSNGQPKESEPGSLAGQNQYRGVLKEQTQETEVSQVKEGAKDTLTSVDRADAIECLIQESIRVKQQFLNIQQMNYSGASRVEEDYTDEDDEDESNSSPGDQQTWPPAHQRKESSHSDNVLAQQAQGKDLPKISEANINDEKSYNISLGVTSHGELRDHDQELSATHSEIQNSMSLLQRKIQFLENKLASHHNLLDGGIKEADSEVEETNKKANLDESRAASEKVLAASPIGAQVNRENEQPRNGAQLILDHESRHTTGGLSSGYTEPTAVIEKPKNHLIVNDVVGEKIQAPYEHTNEDETEGSREGAIKALILDHKGAAAEHGRCRGHFISNSQDSNNNDTLPLQTVEKELGGAVDDDTEHPDPVSFRTSQLSSTQQSQGADCQR